MRSLLVALAIVASLLLSASSCYWRPTREPMPFVTHGGLGPERARGAIVLLPGFGDRPEDFDEHGFVRVLRAQAPSYDVIAADAHFGYYHRATLIEQLRAEVIGPLVARGYREIWLVGVSMGTHGAVAYARSFAERITGLLLFAPYLGPSDTVREVSRAGGICRYTAPGATAESRIGFAQANLTWLKQVLCSNPPQISLWVGVGDQDLGVASGLLAELIEPDHFVVLPGGHEWDVWTPALEVIVGRAFADRRTDWSGATSKRPPQP